MKLRHKKIFISGIAVTVAGVLGIGALLQTSVSVQASSAMMPGIETIVSETTKDDPFRILEIVDSRADAEIGWYVSGQEPYIKLYEYTYTAESGEQKTVHFSTLEEGLSKLPTQELREEFANNFKYVKDENGNYVIDEGNKTVSYDDTGLKNVLPVSNQTGSSEDASARPLSYEKYMEKYFLNEGDNVDEWTEVKLVNEDGSPRIDEVILKGYYKENPSGKGDYTKQPQTYYPIRFVVDKQKQSDKFRENIQSFYFFEGSGAAAPYYLVFDPVSNSTVNDALAGKDGKTKENTILPEYNYVEGKYGYYENVYVNLTEEIANNLTNEQPVFTFPGENPDKPDNSVLIQDNILQTAEAFGEGEVKEFTDNTVSATDSFGSGASEEVPQIQEDVPAADAFSAGDFTDTQIVDDFSGNGIVNMPESVLQENDSVDPLTAEPTETDTGNTERQPEIPFNDPNKAITASNPYVYLGENIGFFPYYKYKLISDLNTVINITNSNAQKDAEALEKGNSVVRGVGDITCKDGQYLYWMMVGSELTGVPLSVVSGRQSVSYRDIQKIPEDLGYDYYFRVKEAYFCCYLPNGEDEQKPENYAYSGWYYPSYPQGEEIYLPAGEKVPTHYISDAQYSLTPGTGDYDFIPDDSKDPVVVEVNHLFYKGGYKNNDWLKKDVFNLEPGTTDFDKFCIQVDTLTVDEFSKKFGTASNSVLSEDAPNAENGSAPFSDSQQNGEVQSLLANDTSSEQTDPIQIVEEYTGTETEEATESSEQTNSTEEQGLFEEQELSEDPLSLEQEEISEEAVTSEVEPMISEAAETLVAQEITADVFSDSTAQEDAPSPENNSENIFTSDSSESFSEGEAVLSDGEEVKPAFSSGETPEISRLAEYDLIYINGKLSETSAVNIAKSTIPCIINAEKAALDENSSVLNAFIDFVKDNDKDGHYVNQYVYFFKNMFEADNSSARSFLLNLNFSTNFNPGEEYTDGRMEGFEEILEYISQENQYRKIGTTKNDTSGSVNFTDDSGNNTDENDHQVNVELLNEDISQARAIEYIINYKYKRNIKVKDEINILEIQPAKIDKKHELRDLDVLHWMGYCKDRKINKVESCCNHSNNSPSKVLNEDQNQIWDIDYSRTDNTGFFEGHNGNYHWLKVSFDEPTAINHFEYTPRAWNGKVWDADGKLVEFSLKFYNGQNELKEINGKFEWEDYYDDNLKTFSFDTVENVSSVQLTFLSAYYRNNNEKVIGNNSATCAYLSFSYITDEMVIPKINITHMSASEFVGHIDNLNSKYDLIYIGDNDTNRNRYINGEAPMLYTHVGASVGIKTADTVEKTTKIVNSLGPLLGQLNNDYDTEYNLENPSELPRFGPFSNFSEDGGGYFRGSGNDITSQKCKELIEFVKSGYPVIIGDKLITTDRAVDKTIVDGSSYYYEFLTEALKYENTLTKKELESKRKSFSFFAYLAKPVIKFAKNGRPADASQLDGSNHFFNNELKYTFVIENDSDVSPARTTYDCKLYFDLNFDGNLSKNEVQDKYITITDSLGNVLFQTSYGENDSRYELKLGEQYTVTRKIPTDYYKLITWKLEISNNTNPYIQTSEIGYAKQLNNTGKKQDIKVLQIIPDKGGTWKLKGDTILKNLLEQNVQDFQIEFEQKKVNEFSIIEDPLTELKKYQIVIIGFDDDYQDIGEKQVNAILDYIRLGRSVIFSHDTTSFKNYNIDKVDTKLVDDINDTEYTLPRLWVDNNKDTSWGLSMNNILRFAVGMDRYGITSDKQINGKTISSLLKEGKELDSADLIQTLLEKVGDVAYQQGNRTKTYAQTQGYTNSMLEGLNLGGDHVTTSIEKVNDGAITKYPFVLDQSFNVANTHGQYLQLALEQDCDLNGISDGKSDIVVWYCLSTNNSGQTYFNSPKDARNFYFYYSKGNVFYTGTGHKGGITQNERKLFINTIVAAASVTAVQPDVHFIKSFNPSAEEEHRRYYMTDQNAWTSSDPNTLEKDMDFYINVKDYNMVSLDNNPTQDMTLDFYIEDENGSVLDPNKESLPSELVGKTLKYLNNDSGFYVTDYATKNTLLSNSESIHISDNGVFQFTVKDIEQYLKQQDNGINGYKQNCKIYVKVTSTVILYGQKTTSTAWASIDLNQRQLFDLD